MARLLEGDDGIDVVCVREASWGGVGRGGFKNSKCLERRRARQIERRRKKRKIKMERGPDTASTREGESPQDLEVDFLETSPTQSFRRTEGEGEGRIEEKRGKSVSGNE